MKMFGSNENKGLLFYGVPQLLIEAANLVSSESDLFVKIAKLSGNSNITHDQQFFRNIRVGKATLEDIKSFFDGLPTKRKFNWKDEACEVKTIGNWFHIHNMMDGLLQSSIADEQDMKDILNFIDAHCQVERGFLIELLEHAEMDKVADYLSRWLLLDKEVVTSNSLEHYVIFEVRICLYWSVIIEKILNTFAYNQYSNCLPCLMPSFKADKNEIVISNEKLLEHFKMEYEQEFHSGKSKPWTYFYRHIAVKKQEDPMLGKDYIIDKVDPDISAIKKQFDRWKKGELFSYDGFLKNLMIIYLPLEGAKRNLDVFLIYFICNILVVVQNKLFTRCNFREDSFKLIELMVDEFAKVHEVRQLIEYRYQYFQSNGSLMY